MLQVSRYRRDFATEARRGQVLIEFSFIALILYLLMAVTFDFGRALYSAQIVQQAADLAARELARTPLAPTSTFSDALADSNVKTRIYDNQLLAVKASLLGSQSLTDYFADKPIVNQMLVPLMITREVNGESWYQYPGQLMDSSNTQSAVKIPIVQGGSVIRAVDVLEEILPASSSAGPFSVVPPSATPAQQAGLVALRINYPFQAAGLTGFENPPDQPLAPSPALDFDGRTYGPYAGTEGLGAQTAFAGQTVRPFRRVISAQAIYRREIFN
jgi:hypothetical protein